MMGHWTTGLLVYGLITTVVTVILASLYAHCGNSETVKDVRGNSNSVTKTEIGLITIDNSNDNFSDEMKECNCGLLQLNWTVLEIIVGGLIGLLLIGGFIKGMMHLKKIIHKRNAKSREEKQKLEKQEKILVKTPCQLDKIEGDKNIKSISIKFDNGKIEKIDTDIVLSFVW